MFPGSLVESVMHKKFLLEMLPTILIVCTCLTLTCEYRILLRILLQVNVNPQSRLKAIK